MDSEDELQMWEQTREDHSGHTLIRQLNEVCTSGVPLEDAKRLVTEWESTPEPPSPPRGPKRYPLGPLLPAFYHAIREGRIDVAACFLEQGVKLDDRAVRVAGVPRPRLRYQCAPRGPRPAPFSISVFLFPFSFYSLCPASYL